MARSLKIVAAIALIATAFAAAWAWQARRSVQQSVPPAIVATLRTEPESFNRLVSASAAVDVVTHLIHAPLIKVDRQTGALMPWLADRWEVERQNVYRLHLKPGLRFSDGTPFSSADVVFTFRALYDPRTASALAGALRIDGRPLTVEAIDPTSVRVTFPAAYGPGLAILDTLPMLPRHRLERALDEGRLTQEWIASADPATITGLGPFMVTATRPGESLTFAPNPHYPQPMGVTPAPGGLMIRIVPDESAEMFQLESGGADLVTGGLRAEEIAAFRALEQQGRVRLHEVGVALDPNALWFNLAPGAPASAGRPWLQQRELRQAISAAVSRPRIVDTVYLGAAEPVLTPVTSGHGVWHARDVAPSPPDPQAADRLLASIGLIDRNGDGVREDRAGRDVRIALLTQRGHTARERTASLIQEDLGRIGVAVDLVPLEVGALIARIGAGDYDAVLFGLQASGIDPALNLDFWMPRGAFHLWHPSQATPATPWESRLAQLMDLVAYAPDQDARVRAFHDAQRLFAAELPAIYFAAPRIVIATSARLDGVRPAVPLPHVLWLPDTLRLAPR